VKYLSLQIGQIDRIEIHQAYGADPRCREVQSDWRAKAARADEQYARFLEPALAGFADLRQHDVAAVAHQLFSIQLGRVGLRVSTDVVGILCADELCSLGR
jgi:hypothetical protein